MAASKAPASSGIANTFSAKIDKSGTNYQLQATDGSLTLATSSAFNISVGGAAQLVFTTQPTNSSGGTAFIRPGPCCGPPPAAAS